MSPEALGTLATLLTAVAAVAGALFATYKYFSHRERFAAIRTAFSEVVDSLGADDHLHRQAGAIMLRRFFDEKTEQGGPGTPYADEALAVIAATLRGVETGPFQKLLADGLAYAPTLEQADLQKTNLQGAYLVARSPRRLDITGADFFRADLSGASLKGADATGAVFYQARLASTVLRSADLRGANFTESDLLGAKLEGASLEGSIFTGARNIPSEIRARLDGDGRYSSDHASGAPVAPPSPTVFLSKPGVSNIDVRRFIDALAARVSDQDFEVAGIEPSIYATTGAVAEVRRVMSGCCGAVVVAVPDLEIREGAWRRSTPQSRDVSATGLATPWTSLELGLAVGLGLPVLLAIADGVDAGLFDYGGREPNVYCVGLTEHHLSRSFREPFDDWCGSVRERARD